MKRVGVAGIIRSGGFHQYHLLMGRRGKDPNRGLYVLPGGGVELGETLEEAFCREVMEETGLKIIKDPSRWQACPDVIELDDRLIFIAHAAVDYGYDGDENNDKPRDGSDLYNVGWYPGDQLPWDTSPVLIPTLTRWGFTFTKKPE
jgi:ADP-ribose pyrophosphatase YjhB (NUDIX family)